MHFFHSSVPLCADHILLLLKYGLQALELLGSEYGSNPFALACRARIGEAVTLCKGSQINTNIETRYYTAVGYKSRNANIHTRGVQFNLLHFDCAVNTAYCVKPIKFLLQ